MTQKRHVLIAEDQTILRQGLRSLLCSSDQFDRIGEVSDGLEAIRFVQERKPDLVLLDLSMPKMNGLEAIREIKRNSPETKVLVLTIHEAERYVLEAFRSGADGYCLKDANLQDLLVAVKNVLAGKRYVSPGISDVVLEGYLDSKQRLKSDPTAGALTRRERQIVKLIAEGYKYKEIADTLCISVKTVERHRSNLMKKLDVHSRSALTAYALQRGIVQEQDLLRR